MACRAVPCCTLRCCAVPVRRAPCCAALRRVFCADLKIQVGVARKKGSALERVEPFRLSWTLENQIKAVLLQSLSLKLIPKDYNTMQVPSCCAVLCCTVLCAA